MTIVDRFGDPATKPERRALGFVERTVADRDQEVMTGVQPLASAGMGWDDRAKGGAGGTKEGSQAHRLQGRDGSGQGGGRP